MPTLSPCLAAVALCACTTGSPLSQIHPQIEVHTDPDSLSLSMTTWVDLDVLHDAIAGDAITATLDGRPLVVDANATGYVGQRDSYVAAFALPATESAIAHPASSQLVITDGAITWSAEIAGLFANDLAELSPSTFVWPSAASPGPDSLIDWACVAVDGQASSCDVTISQQFITVDLQGAPGTHVAITAERSADPPISGDGPPFFVTIDDRLDTQL